MAHRGMHLPEGEVLIHAGDATTAGTPDEVDRFLGWFASHPHPHKILIAGNHDWLFMRDPDLALRLLEKHPSITYLQDSGVEIQGVKFWGAPWQPAFMNWAFNLPRGGQGLRDVWDLIPPDTNVVITHGPPHGVLDQAHGGPHLGCEELMLRLATIKPRLHIFGHIHGGFGVAESHSTLHVNASTCTEAYRSVNRPIVLDLLPKSIRVYGVRPSIRRRRMEHLQGLLASPQGGAPEPVLPGGSPRHWEALQVMAEVRGTSPEALLQEYTEYGLHADLARIQRSENKPSRRLIPFVRLQIGSGGEPKSPNTGLGPTEDEDGTEVSL
jgi:predicted phosphohydrolase